MFHNHKLEKIFKVISFDKKGFFSRSQFQATQRFNEYLWHLQYKFEALEAIEAEHIYADPKKIKRPMQAIQLSLVNCLESYYEQHYATLCAFAHLLKLTTEKGYLPDSITSDNKELINFFEDFDKDINPVFIDTLRKAKDFRNEIVHYKDRVRHDWITITSPVKNGYESSILYFIMKSPAIFFRGGPLDPHDENFIPPVDYKSFYISPKYRDTHEHTLMVIDQVLEKIANDKQSRPHNSVDGTKYYPPDTIFGRLPQRFYLQQMKGEDTLWSKLKNFIRGEKVNLEDKTIKIVKTFTHK